MELAEWLERHYPNIAAEYRVLDGKDVVVSGLHYDRDRKALVNGGQLIWLSRFEHRLMDLFWTRAGEIITLEDISKSVWGQRFIPLLDGPRITKLVSRLRKKTGAEHFVVSRGEGWRFML